MAHHISADRGHEQQEPVEARTSSISGNQILELQRLAGNRAVTGLLGRRGMINVQRFGTQEHLWAGDRDAGRSQAVMLELAPGYSITHGEMIAMAGDYFGTLTQMKELAARPGPGAGTREEIEYVRTVKVRKEEGSFSDAAKTAADKRYYSLAMENRSHFLNPEGAPGTTADRAQLGSSLTAPWLAAASATLREHAVLGSRAGAGYRHYHLEALRLAYEAGKAGRSMNEALLQEGFGGHFLTDAMSGGHLRTPRASVKAYWNARQPMFSYNLAGYLAERLAEKMKWAIRGAAAAGGGILTGGAGALVAAGTVTEDNVYELVLPRIIAKLMEKGELTFGDVVSGALHDFDNKNGVQARVDGAEVTLFGDGSFDEARGEETKKLVARVVDISLADVKHAHASGAGNCPVEEVLPAVTKDRLFGAEHMLPEVLPDHELPEEKRSINWQVESVDDLLGDSKFQEAVKVFGAEQAGELQDVGPTLPIVVRPFFGPAVVDPFKKDPVGLLKGVIGWSADTGGGWFGHAEDGNARAYYYEAKKRGALGTLPVRKRIEMIEPLLEGKTWESEEKIVLDIITANPAHSEEIIAAIGWSELEDELGDAFSDRFPRNRAH